jgi:uncharacterized membrane protein
MTNSEIMKNARGSLNGKWMGEAGTLFLYFVLVTLIYVPDIIIGKFLGEDSWSAIILDFAWDIMLLPLSIGFAWYYNNLSQNKVRSIKNFFYGYSPLFRNLLACVLKWVITTALIAAAFIPLALCLFGNDVVVVVSIVVALILGFYLFYKFFGTIVFFDWRLGEDHKTGIVKLLRECYKRMQPHNDQFFTLNVRFTGWFILCIFTLGIASFWIIPYLFSSYGIFYHQYIYPVEEPYDN